MKRIMIIMMVLIACLSFGCNQESITGESVKIVNIEGKFEDEMNGEDQVATENRIVSIETNKGSFKAVLYEKRAPVTTKNFIELARSGFYDGLSFHRYVPGFVIQGGDPKGDGTGGSSEKIKLEIHPELKHEKGALGMARSMHPDSASSQFYVCLKNQTGLDGSYAVFGKVIDGMDVVENLRKGDVMEKVEILEE
jgi:cyclophilin family peptidyl-prolyl cis-trans isomerase